MNRPAPTKRELESSLEAKFRLAVRAIGGRVSKLAPTDKGMPDRMVLLPGGRLYLVELKTTTGRLSAAQQLWHQRATELGTGVITLSGEGEIRQWVRQQAGYFDPKPRQRRRRQDTEPVTL